MARRTFFSFHYKPDIQRAQTVRNSWITKDRESSGFFDSSVFEAKKKEGTEELKRFLREALKNTSVTCVLAGAETYSRRWVQYELVRSFKKGNGILCVKIGGIKDWDGEAAIQGPSPLTHLAYKVDDGIVSWQIKSGENWKVYSDVPTMKESEVVYDISGKKHHEFSALFKTHSWTADDGYNNLGKWIETAANAAGR